MFYTTYEGETARAVVWKCLYPELLESYVSRIRVDRWFRSSKPLLVLLRRRKGPPESFLLLSANEKIYNVSFLYTIPSSRKLGLGTSLLSYATSRYPIIFHPPLESLDRMAQRIPLVWEWKIQGYRSSSN